MKNNTLSTWVVIHDLHYPEVDFPTFKAILGFIDHNKVAGLVLGGDQFANNEISHHTKHKPIYRERASYKRNTLGFDRDILKPLEQRFKAKDKVWIVGNHDDWERQLIEEQPELEGIIERPEALKLTERGWEIVPLGHRKRLGKLNVIHGETLTGIGNQAGMYPAKKAVELYASSVLAGHTHAPQSFTKVSPVEDSNRWMGWIAPICSNTNPDYLRNRPTAWVTGFTIVELFKDGSFNVFPVVTVKGRFAYGGKVYGSDGK